MILSQQEVQLKEPKQISVHALQLANDLKARLPEYTEAVVAIQSKDSSRHLPVLRRNKFFRTYEQFFSPEMRWIGGNVKIDEGSFKDQESISMMIRLVEGVVRPLYDLADSILDTEIPGMNSHDIDHHVLPVLKHFENLSQLVEQSTGVAIPNKEKLIGCLTVLLHDVAQGLTGRNKHAWIGAIMTNQMLVGQDEVGTEIIQKVVNFVETHITKRYNYDIDSVHPESKVYAGMVLADESDICRNRVTARGRELFLNGSGDDWILLNYFSKKSKWVLDDLGRPQWQLHLSLNSDQDLSFFIHAFRDRFPKEALTVDNLQAHYTHVFTKEVVNGVKINLFKSSIKKLFGHPDFSIELIDLDGTKLMTYYLGRKNAPQRYPNKHAN